MNVCMSAPINLAEGYICKRKILSIAPKTFLMSKVKRKVTLQKQKVQVLIE